MLVQTLKKRGCNKNERTTHHTNTTTKHSKDKKKDVRINQMKLELSYIQKHNNGRRGHREGERVHLL